MRGSLVAAMLVVATLGGVASQARAGMLGDAMVAVGNWVSEAETAMTGWFERLWRRAVAASRDERAADAFRELVVQSPERLDALAGRAGYALSTYVVARGERQDLILRFRHDRDLDPAERSSLARELRDPVALDIRPELALLRILLDAADWRDAGLGSRYLLTGVEVQVDDAVSSRLIFSEPKVPQ